MSVSASKRPVQKEDAPLFLLFRAIIDIYQSIPMPKVTRELRPHTDEKAKQTSDILKKLRTQSIEAEAEKLAQEVGLPYIDLHLYPADPEDVNLLPEEDAKKHTFALFKKDGLHAFIALGKPESPEAQAYCQALADSRGWRITLAVASIASLEKVWSSYGKHLLLESLDLMRVSLKGEDLNAFEKNFGDLLKLKEQASVSTSQIIEVVLAGATKLRGSDVHIEPGEDTARLRYRIDGILQDIGNLPHSVYHLALARIKMLASMKLNVRDRAQDGHFFILLGEERIDIRVSIIPGNHGENINMRLLNRDDVFVEMAALGLRGVSYTAIEQAVQKTNGMILNTGPTGSGKTTTLYSILQKINSPEIKIITIEDPIEYSLPGIVQTEVSKDREYTFATALRAIVRQDPDVVLVGEIRDDETADVAINAALTGHLVLTTLHTNNAIATIPRLLELGVKPSLIASAVNLIIGQRLVRVLCPKCKEAYAPAPQTIAALKKLLAFISPAAHIEIPESIEMLYRPKGCVDCNFTGYHGRIGIFEIVPITQSIRDSIGNLGTEKELFDLAFANGLVTMAQDGLLKVLDGSTTMDEVWRATGKDETLSELYKEFDTEAVPTKPKEEADSQEKTSEENSGTE